MPNYRSEQIVMKNWNGDSRVPLVTICCTTYNHRKYIEEAIISFLNQDTDFPFEILIHDDASTDGTDEIIKKYERIYPSIIRVIYQKENQYSKGRKPLIELVLPQTKGKYVAICEGDDYWTDIHKLEKQIKILESNTEISLSIHSSKIIDQRNGTIDYLKASAENCTFAIETIIENGGNFFATSSMVLRREFIHDLPDYIYNAPLGDYPLSIFCASKGIVSYLKDVMSVYRKFNTGSWSDRILSDSKKNKEYAMSIIKMLFEIDRYYEYKYAKSIEKRIETSYLSSVIDTELYYDDRIRKIIKNQKIVLRLKFLIKRLIKIIMNWR